VALAPLFERLGWFCYRRFRILFLSTASAAKSLRFGCGSMRRPPACSTHRSPTAALHVGQGTEDSCFRVSCFTFIPETVRQDPNLKLLNCEHFSRRDRNSDKQDFSGLGRASRVAPSFAESRQSNRTVGGGCVYILPASSHTPSAAPATGDGSCANRLTSGRTGCEATVRSDLTGSPTGLDSSRCEWMGSRFKDELSKK